MDSMQGFEEAASCLQQQPMALPSLERAMRMCAESPQVQAGIATLLSPNQSSGTISSLYLGFKSLVLHQSDGWALSLARIQSPAEAISAPASVGAALCIQSAAPLEFDTYVDDVEYDPADLRPPLPIRRKGVRLVRPGDVVAFSGSREWSVPKGEIDAIFLKIDGPIRQPLSITFDPKTLLPLHSAFADQDHTAKDFFGTLIGSLFAPGETALATMEREERAALVDYLAAAAEEDCVHLTTRWKYLQSLARLDPRRAVRPLERIAGTSKSEIGDKARSILAAHREKERRAAADSAVR